MDVTLERAWQLKQNLAEFLLEAEGALAEALEAFVAKQLQSQPQGLSQRDLLVDVFAIKASVEGRLPLDWFLEASPDLSEGDRQLVSNWRQGFAGLFAVTERLPGGFQLRNWLTDKFYTVKPGPDLPTEQLQRWQSGEIIRSYLVPLDESTWMLFGPYSLLGKLGKPKLAVAIGNFKQHHKQDLYGDAPELLEQAWESVESYHQEFVAFFGSAELTLPGYQLSKKLSEFQTQISQKRLAAAGIDMSKSLAEAARDAGVEEAELEAAAAEAGIDAKLATQMLHNKTPSQMVAPKVELPPELKQAEQVTVLAHPRWGQMFLPAYSSIKTALSAADPEALQNAAPLLRKSLADPSMNWFVWHQLAQEFPSELEKALQIALERPQFQIQQDLTPLLINEFHKSTEPELPEIASVPVHLDNLFQEALAEVQTSKSKGKGKKKSGKGFQA